jgi:hypothetical protein
MLLLPLEAVIPMKRHGVWSMIIRVASYRLEYGVTMVWFCAAVVDSVVVNTAEKAAALPNRQMNECDLQVVLVVVYWFWRSRRRSK